MKKFLSLSLAAMLTIMMCGCTKAEIPPSSDKNEYETEGIVSNGSVDTSNDTASSEKTAVTSPEITTVVTDPSEESVTSPEITTDVTDPTELYTAEFPVGIDMSQYNGKFYQWKFDRDIVTDNEEDFEGGKNVISSAKAIAEDYFKSLVMSSDAVTEEENITYRQIEFDYDYWNWGYIFQEEYLDEILTLYFSQGVYDDFDNDGKKESFIVFCNKNRWGNPISFAVFIDSSGNPKVLTESVSISSSRLYPIRYNGFIHLIVDCGCNNSTIHAEFYAVENGEAVHKHKECIACLIKPYKDVFMETLAVQRSGSWLVFWNEELNEYCTVAGDKITDKESEKLFEVYSEMKDDNNNMKFINPKQIQINTRKFGNIYCIDNQWRHWSYEYKDGKFQDSENVLIPGEEMYTEVFVSGIDFNNIEDKTVKLPN